MRFLRIINLLISFGRLMLTEFLFIIIFFMRLFIRSQSIQVSSFIIILLLVFSVTLILILWFIIERKLERSLIIIDRILLISYRVYWIKHHYVVVILNLIIIFSIGFLRFINISCFSCICYNCISKIAVWLLL